MLAKREETLVRVTGKTAAQRAEEERLFFDKQRLLVEEQRRKDEEYARQGELRAESRKIEREAGCPSPFRTVHGVGYQLSETVDILLEAEISR
jgi:hypothetical protein